MRLEELARTAELRGPGAGDPTDWEAAFEAIRIELDAEHATFAAELRRHEAAVFELLQRKARATEGIRQQS